MCLTERGTLDRTYTHTNTHTHTHTHTLSLSLSLSHILSLSLSLSLSLTQATTVGRSMQKTTGIGERTLDDVVSVRLNPKP
jgi:hypothetical protein